jgi:hypothetical protein
MLMANLVQLSEQELIALAGLTRLMIRLDGRFTHEERNALRFIATRVALASAEGKAAALGEERWWSSIDRAARALPDDASIREAALRVVRTEARESIHQLLCEVASADFAEGGEQGLLMWLAREWQLAY